MRLSFPVLLLAIVAAAPAFAQEPDVLDSGAIAEVCKVKFPGDPEAIKACEVSIRVIIDHRVDERIARLEMLVEYLMETNYGLDHRVAELEARIAELESPSPKNEPSIESAPASPTLDCENVRVYLSIEARRACREARDAPVPK